MQDDKEPVSLLTVTANIVHHRTYGPGGSETKIGTKHFSPGTKVYIIDWFAGMCEDIIVVGLSRKPRRRWICVVIRATWVENLRVKPCYHPLAVERIKKYGEEVRGGNISWLTVDFVEQMKEGIPVWQKEMRKKT